MKGGARVARFIAFAAGFYSLVLVAFLWPWPQDPAHLAINSNDLLLHTWSMAFVVHQMGVDPRHLFDANMFWPQPGALSYTETLFPQSAMAAPVFWLGGGALLAHNLVLFLTIVISGVTSALLALRLTSSRAAALIAGLGYAFGPFRFHHLVQIGVASYEWFPLVLLALWQMAAGPRQVRSLVMLSVAAVLQALSSGYYAVLLGFVITAAVLFLARRLWRKDRLLPVLGSLAIAGAVALLAGAPSVRLRDRQAVSRGTEGPIHWSAVPRSYLDPGPNVLALGLGKWIERTPEPLFPGIAISALCVLGFVRTRNRPARGLLVSVGLVCALMAAGPVFRDLPLELPAPFELIRHIPPADMIRAPSRFGIGAVLAIDLMAALGFAFLERQIPRRFRVVVCAAAVAFMLAEMRPSIAYSIRPIPKPPAFTAALAPLPRGGVLELPWSSEEAASIQLYWSTEHWQPLISGYGGFAPAGNFPLAAMAQNFPTGFASRLLRCAGVRYVVVHGADVPDTQAQRAQEFELRGVRRIGRFDSDFLFELSPWEAGVACPPEMPEGFARP